MKNLPFSLHTGLCAALLVPLVLAATARAQSDPFGLDGDDPFQSGDNTGNDPGEIFGGQVAAPAAGRPSAAGAVDAGDETDPIILMLRERPPQSPKEMARGLTWMMRLKRFDEVGRLLSLVQTPSWTAQAKADLSREGGMGLWLKLSADSAQLSEDQRALVREILAAPAKLARDPAWINRWIGELASTHPGRRQLARLRLQDSGSKAIEVLVQRLFSGDKRVPGVELARAIGLFGSQGTEALKAAATISNPDKAGRVLAAIAKLHDKNFSLELATAVAGDLIAEDDKQRVVASLNSQFKAMPTASRTATALSNALETAISVYQHSRGMRGQTPGPAWVLTPTGDSIVLRDVDAAARALEQAAHLARLSLHLPLEAKQRSRCMTVVLQAAYKSGLGEDRDVQAAAIAATLKRFAADEKVNLVSVLDESNELQMHGAVVAVVRLIASGSSGPALGHLDLMTKLLRDSRPVVRYTALEAIADIDPKSAFGGAEPSLDVALEMSRLESGPSVLVIGLHSDLRNVAQQQIESMSGGKVITTNSARGAISAIGGDDPIEMIVIVDRVSDQSLFMLLQRLRAGRGSHALPIAILTDELYQHERELIAAMPGVVSSVLARDPAQMQRVLDLLAAELDTDPMDSVDRARFAQSAAHFIARIGSDRNTYGFYPLSDLRNRMPPGALQLSDSRRAGLLGGLGTRNSQQALVVMAASSDLSRADRLGAAAAFATSVEQFGMIIGQTDVRRNYDLYNKLGPTDPVAATSLGRVLDVIEAHAANAGAGQ